MRRNPLLLRPYRLNRVWGGVALTAPVVTSLTPNTGPSAGGTPITNLAGSGFLAGAVAKFGGSGGVGGMPVAAAFVSPVKLTCVTPPGTAGLADVVVVNPDTTESDASGFGAFTYVGAPQDILTEDGFNITTEGGDPLLTES